MLFCVNMAATEKGSMKGTGHLLASLLTSLGKKATVKRGNKWALCAQAEVCLLPWLF